MTQLLQRAFSEASKLPDAEQDAFASLLLAELESERRWSLAFASTQNQLAKLADDAPLLTSRTSKRMATRNPRKRRKRSTC